MGGPVGLDCPSDRRFSLSMPRSQSRSISISVSPDLAWRYERNLALMASLTFREEELDYGVLERHLPFLERLDEVGSSAISVFDLFRRAHVYVSPHYRERLGLIDEPTSGPIPDGLDELMHPDDLVGALDAGFQTLRFVLEQPRDAWRHLKVLHDFRLRRSATEWVRVVEQYMLLETAPDGTIWLTLSIVDVSPDQDLETPFRGSIVDLRTSEVVPISRPAAPLADEDQLSNREREVLYLVASGLASKEIAEGLFLSVHTVNTHRQNILRKTGAHNSAGAIRYAQQRGLI
jgi:DNA-binding CsgD family transcriptional regulator